MFARLASSSSAFSQKVTDVALPPLRSTHQWPWSKPGRSAMEGAFTSLKMEMHSSIFSGLTWMVTTRANMVFLPPDPLYCVGEVWKGISEPLDLLLYGFCSSYLSGLGVGIVAEEVGIEHFIDQLRLALAEALLQKASCLLLVL